jgi:hypothetical protein
MEVMALSIRLKEEGAAAVQAALKKLRLSSILTGAAVGTGLALALRKLVTASSEAQAVQAQLANAIQVTGEAAGQTIEQLNAHAASLQAITTFSSGEINRAQARLLSYTEITDKNFTRATEVVLDYAAAFTTDLVQASEAVGKALNYPTQGLAALSKQGFIFTESQKQQIKFFEDTNQLAKAQAIIFEELESVTKNAAAAQRNTLGGALKALENAWDSLFEVSRESSQGIIDAIEGIIAVLPKLRNALNEAFLVAPILLADIQLRVARLSKELAESNLRWAEFFRNVTFGIAGRGLLAQETKRLQKAEEDIAKLEKLKLERQLKFSAAGAEVTLATQKQTRALREQVVVEQQRRGDLIALAGLTALTRQEFAALTRAEREVASALARGNVPLDERVRLLEEQRTLLDAITGATVRGERERIDQALARPMADRAPITLPPITVSPVSDVALARAKQQLADANALVERMRALGPIGEEQLQKAQATAMAARQFVERLQSDLAAPEGPILFKLPPVRDITQGMTADAARQAQAAADELAVSIEDTFAAAVATSLVAGIAGGIEAALASGNISAGFNALGSAMLSGLGDAAIRFGTETMALGTIMQDIISGFASLLPGGAIAKGALMVAFGAALKGAAGAAFGGGRPIGRSPTNPLGAFAGGTIGAGMPTQIIFGQTSATTAAGMTPRSSTNVTIIGPDDPKAQRAIEELITKGNRRGTLG